jgi:hypothetical protein
MMKPAVIGLPVATAAAAEDAGALDDAADDAAALAGAAVLAADDAAAEIGAVDAAVVEGVEVAAVLVELEQADNTRAAAMRAPAALAARCVLRYMSGSKGMA